MNIQMREFVHRLIRTFGSPLKLRILRNSYGNAKETVELQNEPLQMDQEVEGQLKSASIRNTTPVAKPSSILATDKSVASTIVPPARGSTINTVESPPEDSRQLLQEEHSEEDESQLTEGPSRVVTAFDGTKDCVALLLTERLITEFNDIAEETQQLEKAENELREANLKASMAERTAEGLIEELARTEDPDLTNDLSQKIETQKQIFIANTGQCESLRELITARSRNLKFGQMTFQNIFKRALEDANLLNIPELRTQTVDPGGAAEDREDSVTVSETDESIVSAEELLRRNAYDDWEFTRENLAQAQFAFDNRQVRNERALMEYQDELDEGITSCTQSEFDRLAVGRMQKSTRALIDAEADYADAVQRAQALGVLMNEVDQESNFVSDISDGYYPASGDTTLREAVDITFVEYWNDNVDGSGPEELEELEEPQEPDDWDAQTVGISDSVSVVDYSRNRKRIDRWREMCEQ